MLRYPRMTARLGRYPPTHYGGPISTVGEVGAELVRPRIGRDGGRSRLANRACAGSVTYVTQALRARGAAGPPYATWLSGQWSGWYTGSERRVQHVGW